MTAPMTTSSAARHTQKFLAMGAGLFPALNARPVEATAPAAPAAPAVPAAAPDAGELLELLDRLEVTRRPEQPAAPVVRGPSPLMRDAYQDIEATADRIVQQAAAGLRLSVRARRLYRLLVVAAVGNARARGLDRVPDVAEIHLPGELVALLMDCDRTTVWRAARDLGEVVDQETGEVTGAQLVAWKDHKTGAAPIAAQAALEARHAARGGKGRAPVRAGVSDGLLWAVSLTGPRPGLQVSAEALRHEWRDLYSDSLAAARNKGHADGLRTVWALKNRGLQQSLEDLRAEKGEELAVRWTVNPGFSTPPPSFLTVATGLQGTLSGVWDVQTVRTLAPRQRGVAVDSAAQYLADAMQDHGSVGLYRWVLWRLLRLDTVGVNLWDAVLLLLDQVRGDQLAGDTRHAGAVVMWRLKGSGLWEHLKNAPRHRVGSAA